MTKELKKSIKKIVAEIQENSLDKQWLSEFSMSKRERYHSTDPSKIYFIKKGSLLVSKTITSSAILDVPGINNMIYEIFAESELVALENISDEKIGLTFELVALDETSIISIDKEYLLNYCTNKPSFMETLLKYVTLKNLQYEEQSLAFLGSREQRLSWSIVHQKQNSGVGMNNRILSKLSSVDESFASRNIKKITKFMKIN
ncbi:hypothetical protein [Listeria kieliensis]|uniref:Cyclic nucleotide-binding domain-containing protein n=1 Tax=Listeria kieliensis TaxID=1621700 RepID=A0A3D8TR44_9LIST|nr:hypothetical protein [Listeria kieliensis]RDX01358.1 hypothetical protein UR08_10605 [Listeria kieliensis]